MYTKLKSHAGLVITLALILLISSISYFHFKENMEPIPWHHYSLSLFCLFAPLEIFGLYLIEKGYECIGKKIMILAAIWCVVFFWITLIAWLLS